MTLLRLRRRKEHIGRMGPVDHAITALVYASRRPVISAPLVLLLQLLGTYIPRSVTIGDGLVLPHAYVGHVVHPSTRIGNNVTIFHGVTIGRADAADPKSFTIPGCEIEDDAVICAGAVILAPPDRPLTIGRGAVIGANAVVTRSVPAGETWAGAPARRIDSA